MEIRLPKELPLFFLDFSLKVCQNYLCQACKLSPPKVAPHSSDESWRVVEDLRIFCALKLRRASRPQNLNSPFVGTKCLLVGHHHLLEEAPHANEVVHDSRRRRMRSRRSALPFFWVFFYSVATGRVKPSQSIRDSSSLSMSSSISSGWDISS